MVGIGCNIATLYALHPAPEMALRQLVVLQHAALLEAVHSQQRQSVPRSLVCKCKDIELPVAARILQISHFPECSFTISNRRPLTCRQKLMFHVVQELHISIKRTIKHILYILSIAAGCAIPYSLPQNNTEQQCMCLASISVVYFASSLHSTVP